MAVPIVSNSGVKARQGRCLGVAVDFGTRGWLEGRQKIEPEWQKVLGWHRRHSLLLAFSLVIWSCVYSCDIYFGS
jgi:hypothetical protein